MGWEALAQPPQSTEAQSADRTGGTAGCQLCLQNPLTVAAEPAGGSQLSPRPIKTSLWPESLGKLQCSFDGGNERGGVKRAGERQALPAPFAHF